MRWLRDKIRDYVVYGLKKKGWRLAPLNATEEMLDAFTIHRHCPITNSEQPFYWVEPEEWTSLFLVTPNFVQSTNSYFNLVNNKIAHSVISRLYEIGWFLIPITPTEEMLDQLTEYQYNPFTNEETVLYRPDLDDWNRLLNALPLFMENI